MAWTPDVEPTEAQVFVHAVSDILTALRRLLGHADQFDPLPMVRVFGAWVIPSVPQGAAYWGVQWYVQHSLDQTHKRLLGSRYLQAIQLEPWQHSDPHFDLALTDLALLDDTMGDEGREVLGVSQAGLAAVISSHLVRTIANLGLRRMALRHAVAHYFGRMIGAPRLEREQAVRWHADGGLYCTNPCAMRYIPSADRALLYALEQNTLGELYCETCQRDMVALLVGFHYGPN
jgi:hypothetical protein